ncbi:MAG TPA: hypothetical protein VLM85_06600 [Polyangiaceae bacterium]|nr:hypothetical protein [Polyangiaceae bacterium]
MSSSSTWLPLLLVSTMALACGGSTPDTGDAGDTQDAAPAVETGPGDGGTPKIDAGFPGPHPSVPQVETYGGSVLTAPKVIPIFFSNDADQSKVEDFLGKLAASPYWGQTTTEYGVGALTVGTSIVVTDTPPTTTDVAKIETWLTSYLDGTHPEFPPIDTNNIYTVFFPASTTISDPSFGTSCVQFGGYHYSTTSNGKDIVYAVLPRCSSLGDIQGFDALSGGLSHELIEASTDPLSSNPSFAFVDTDHFVWNIMPLGEVGDMCAYEPQSYQRLVGTYMVQRVWSNAAAKAGHDPCVPPLSDAYFNAAPVLSDNVTLTYYNQNVPTKGIQIGLNQSKTIPVQLFSDGPTTDWTVQAVDSTYGTGNPAELQFSWDKQSGNNGDTLQMTITRVRNGSYGGSEFILYAQKGLTTANLWFGFVAN